MKPTTTTKKHRSHNQSSPSTNLPATQRRVTVEFLPQSGWQVEIGRTPAKAFAAPQTVRDIAPVTGYKRAHGSSQPTHVFVPVGLMSATDEQRATPRYRGCRATPKLPVNL